MRLLSKYELFMAFGGSEEPAAPSPASELEDLIRDAMRGDSTGPTDPSGPTLPNPIP